MGQILADLYSQLSQTAGNQKSVPCFYGYGFAGLFRNIRSLNDFNVPAAMTQRYRIVGRGYFQLHRKCIQINGLIADVNMAHMEGTIFLQD
ncbi:hypothetical protein D3C75_940260 [compost metagenome]